MKCKTSARVPFNLRGIQPAMTEDVDGRCGLSEDTLSRRAVL